MGIMLNVFDLLLDNAKQEIVPSGNSTVQG